MLVSRRPPGETARSVVEQLEGAGATVRVLEADVSDRKSLERVLQTIDRELPPLYGVVHTAGVIEGATLTTMRPDQFRRVLAGKAAGAVHLHALTAARPLGLFLLYSSVAPLIGAAGEAHYAGASAFLDALAAFRRGRGLPGSSINWGPWDAGMIAADDRRGIRMRDLGFTLLTEEVGRACFMRTLAEVPVQAVAVKVDWQRFAEMLPEIGGWPFFADVVARPEGAAPVGLSVREAVLAARPGRERTAALEDEVRQLVSRVLRQNAARIDAAKTFRALGLDSLMGLELRTQLERRFAIPVPATLVWNFPTVSGLSREMARRADIPLNAEAPAAERSSPAAEPSSPPDADLEAMLAQIEQLSDEEARTLLEKDREGRG